MLTEDEARALTKQILALAKAPETHVSVSSSRTTNLRFARSEPTTSGETDDLTISVTSVRGKRAGSSSINQRDRASLEAVVRRAEAIAERAPEDPERMPGLGPQTYPAIPHAFDADTAAPSHVLSRELGASNLLVPALKLSGFALSSVSDAV